MLADSDDLRRGKYPASYLARHGCRLFTACPGLPEQHFIRASNESLARENVHVLHEMW